MRNNFSGGNFTIFLLAFFYHRLLKYYSATIIFICAGSYRLGFTVSYISERIFRRRSINKVDAKSTHTSVYPGNSRVRRKPASYRVASRSLLESIARRRVNRRSTYARDLRNSKFSMKTSIGSRGISGARERRCRWIHNVGYTCAGKRTGDDCR